MDSRLLWQTVSNTAVRLTTTQTDRSAGLLWLNPMAISVVSCRSAEVVEWPGRNLCWSVAEGQVSIDTRQDDASKFLTAGKISEMGLYDVYWDMYLSGLGIGIQQVDTESLKKAEGA